MGSDTNKRAHSSSAFKLIGRDPNEHLIFAFPISYYLIEDLIPFRNHKLTSPNNWTPVRENHVKVRPQMDQYTLHGHSGPNN